MTKKLAETNPYLRDPKKRQEILLRQALESSAFEGARGLKVQLAFSKPKAKARLKKSVKGS